MSQITRCPACETQFKVASDQLRASEGWVRCGQCDEIFDAVAHLVPLDSFPVLSQVVPAQRKEPPVPPLASVAAPVPAPPPAPAPEALHLSPSETEPADSAFDSIPPLDLPPAPALHADQAPDSAAPAEASPIDDFAAQLRQALDFPPPRPQSHGPTPDVEPEAFPDFTPPPEALEDEEPAIALDFPAFAPADLPADEGLDAGFKAESTVEADRQDNAVDPDLLGAKLSFPDDARAPDGTEAADLLSERVAAEMDEVVLHLHESAQEPPVPEWMAHASAVQEAPPVAAPPALGAEDGLLPPDGGEPRPAGLPSMAMPPLEGDEPPQAAGEPLPAMDLEPEAPPQAAAAVLGAAGAATAAAVAAGASSAAADRWRHRGVRATLGAVAAVLSLTLLAQAAVQWREPLLRWSGANLPWLQALCAPYQCTLAAPRQVADLVIDASAFHHVQEDRYELSMTLHNRAVTAMTMPALELTLTDAQDQALVRRVLQPADLGAPAELPPGERWEARLPVMLAAPDLSVASYRLLAFYP